MKKKRKAGRPKSSKADVLKQILKKSRQFNEKRITEANLRMTDKLAELRAGKGITLERGAEDTQMILSSMLLYDMLIAIENLEAAVRELRHQRSGYKIEHEEL